uniref:KIB1-4 beta-propeller domain-containing protein n=1 Tax=Leersia perrieri TaxID=77586 RepID=A0A0D9XTD6_9ORYZ
MNWARSAFNSQQLGFQSNKSKQSIEIAAGAGNNDVIAGNIRRHRRRIPGLSTPAPSADRGTPPSPNSAASASRRRRTHPACSTPPPPATNSPPSSTPRQPAPASAGSAHGWLFTTDAGDANPYLLNPLTGERASLPPITTLPRVIGRKRRVVDDEYVYDVDFASSPAATPDVRSVDVAFARRTLFRRVAISASPSAAGGGGCVVLLLHGPHGELFYARPGGVDERWTPITAGGDGDYHDAIHNPVDGKFYLLQDVDLCDALKSIDLAAAVAVAGAHLDHSNIDEAEVAEELDGGVGDDHVLFIGNAAGGVCLRRVEDCGGAFRGNCAYMTDDDEEVHPPDIGVWDLNYMGEGGHGGLTMLQATWPLHDLDTSGYSIMAPVWFTPSLD